MPKRLSLAATLCSILALPLLAGASALALGCSHQYIANSDLEDNDENWKVVHFCEKYRRAIEERDVETLVALASPRYFETGGNAKSGDDMDYNGLRTYLATKFKQTKAIRYEIRYHRISEVRLEKVGDKVEHVLNVDYTYTASFQIPTSKGDVWNRAVRDNRLQIVTDGESFKILAGM